MPDDPSSGKRPLAERYAALLARFATPVVVGLLLITVVLGLFAWRLELRTDFTDLLPEERTSVQALRRINQRLGGVGTLNVAVQTEDPQAARRFAEDLVAAVQDRLADQIRSIDYTVAPVRELYRRHGALFLSVQELEELDRALAEAIHEEKLKANPFYVELDEPGPAASQRVRRLSDRIEERGRSLDRFPEGYYLGEGGKLLGIFLRPRGSAVEIAGARRLLERLQRLVDELQPQSYHPSLQVSFTGTLQTTVEEYSAIVRDIAGTAGLCVLLVSAVIWIYFRLVRVLILFSMTLTAGAVWAFGLGSLLYGYVNAQTAFLGSIIVGTGINYGIILVARYLEERRAGLAAQAALADSLRVTLRPTLAAALTTALAFGTLGFAEMRSFAQFGFIGAVGMAACWLLSYTLLPALLLLLERLPRLQPRLLQQPRRRLRYPQWLAALPIRHPLPVLAITGLLVAASVAQLVAFLPDSLESDTNKLRNRSSLGSPTAQLDDRLQALFGETLTPAVIIADDTAQAAEVCRAMDRLRERNPSNPVVSWCRSIHSFVPTEQAAKLAVIRRIRERLQETPRELLPAEVRGRLQELRGRLPARPLRRADLPEEIRSRFRERSGAETIVVVAPGERRILWKMEDLHAFAGALRTVELPGGRVLHSSGESVIFADLIDTIAGDAPRTTALAAGTVLLVLAVVLRRPRPVGAVGVSLIAGVTVMVGIAALFRIKYNFFNFVALPTTFGIAVDYPVNVEQRAAAEGRGQLQRALRRTGLAVVVASLTTIIGYAVLLISDSRALASFGGLAIIGEVTCLAAAVLLLPAVLRLLERERAPAPVPVPERQA